MEKHYCTEVFLGQSPVPCGYQAQFCINETLARRILETVRMLEDKGLYSAEILDNRVRFERSSPSGLEQHSELILTEAGSLHITEDVFWFKAYAVQGHTVLSTQGIPIADLARCFGKYRSPPNETN